MQIFCENSTPHFWFIVHKILPQFFWDLKWPPFGFLFLPKFLHFGRMGVPKVASGKVNQHLSMALNQNTKYKPDDQHLIFKFHPSGPNSQNQFGMSDPTSFPMPYKRSQTTIECSFNCTYITNDKRWIFTPCYKFYTPDRFWICIWVKIKFCFCKNKKSLLL